MEPEEVQSCVNVQNLQASLTAKVDVARRATFDAVAETEYLVDVAFNLKAQGILLCRSAAHATDELRDLASLLELTKRRASEIFGSEALTESS
jgi:hypothetical protein